MKKSEPENKYVEHPRYGSKPIDSGNFISKSEIEGSHWRYSSLRFFSNSAIRANVEKQNYSIYPRPIYVDIEEQCVSCNRYFLFFALEQKYWFEDLGFWIDSHCTRCVECRKKDQEIKKIHIRYQKLKTKPDKTSQEIEEAKELFLELHKHGVIKNMYKIKNIG